MRKAKFDLKRNLRLIISYVDLLRFSIHKFLLGFDSANNFIRRVDKTSIQLILKRNGARIGKNCDIEAGLIFHNCEDYRNLIVGDNCHIGKKCFFDLRDKVIVENNVVISMQCTFITHLDMTKSQLSKFYPQEQKPIKINNNCYLSVRSTVLMGIELGENSFVAAGSLITKDVPPYTMVGGVPAKVIKSLNLQ